MTSFQPSVLGAEVWPPPRAPWVIPAPLAHSLPEPGPPTGSCFPRPMKSSLFPAWVTPAGWAVTSAPPRAALGIRWQRGFVPRKRAGTVGGSIAQHGYIRRSVVGDAVRESPEEQLQKPCFSRLPAGKTSPRIPGVVLKPCRLSLPVPATPGHGTCYKHLFLWQRWHFIWVQDREGAVGFQVCFETTIRALYGFKITILQYWQTITSSRKAAL